MAAQLPDPQRRALSSAFGADAGPQPERFIIGLAALNLLAGAAARTPVLMVVDDVQWLDRPTQEVLVFMARRISAEPIVVVGGVRNGHDTAFTSAGLTELHVSGLDDASARDLLTSHAGDLSSADRERILKAAQGNALALIELPAALRTAAAAGLVLLPPALPLTTRLERAFAPPATGSTSLSPSTCLPTTRSAPVTASGSVTPASPPSTSPPARRSSPPSTGPAGSCATTRPRN